MSNSLDSDQARHFVRSDLGPNCLQRLSADNKICRQRVGYQHSKRWITLQSKYHVGKGDNFWSIIAFTKCLSSVEQYQLALEQSDHDPH